jgi:hypothetical protein
MNETIEQSIKTTALSLAYSSPEITAAMEFHLRKTRRSNPPGTWDNAGRFYAAERTAAHCAELQGADCVTYVRRIALAIKRLEKGESEESIRKLLLPGVKIRKARCCLEHELSD